MGEVGESNDEVEGEGRNNKEETEDQGKGSEVSRREKEGEAGNVRR